MSHDPAAGQIAAYLDWYFDRNPVHADALGVPGHSHRLGDFSAAAFDSSEREAAEWLTRFEAEPDGIDRDLIVSALRGQLLMAGFLTGFAERATGDWRMGETLYSALLQQQELLSYGAAELHRRGVAAWDTLNAQMRELAVRVPGGSTDWRATMEALLDDHPPTLEAMRAEYEAETARARAFLADHELVQHRINPSGV